MNEYSEFIVKTMEYLDKKIQDINPKNMDRERLHNAINIKLVANVEKIMPLETEERKAAVRTIFWSQLDKEMRRKN